MKRKMHVIFLLMTTFLLAAVFATIPTKSEGATSLYDDSHVYNGKIVFERSWADTTGKTQIHLFTMNTDGSDATQLTFIGLNERPSWSPDGKMIAFVSDRTGTFQLFTMYEDGSHQKRITHDRMNYWDPCWSPDGTKIACVRWDPDSTETSGLFIMDADGSNLRLLVDGRGPNWSPDGTKIAFGYCHKGDWSAPDAGLYVINPDGTGKIHLFITGDRCIFHPKWSPDGKKIMFLRCSTEGQSLFVMKADGSKLKQLILPTTSTFDPIGCYWGFCWSPDGKKIAFTHNGQVYIMNPDGTNIIQLTYGYKMIDWQPLYQKHLGD